MLTQRPSNKDQGQLAYILVTAVKNEEDNLPTLIESIVNQTLRPVAWFIVDDGSEDKSVQIVEEAMSEHSWIHLLKLSKHRGYSSAHYARACVEGFAYALTYCKRNSIEFEYVALADGDMLYSTDYFSRCVAFLDDNPEFGIVSGRLLIKKSGGITYEEKSIVLGDGEPYGGGRVWRKKAFEDTGGYPLKQSPDAISNIKALLKGWKIRLLPDVLYYQTRDTGGKTGLWSGYLNRGERAYYLGMTPLAIFSNIVDMMFISRQRSCAIKSLALLAGYCKSFLQRKERLDDKEVRRYMGSYRRSLKNYWLFLRRLTKKGKLR